MALQPSHLVIASALIKKLRPKCSESELQIWSKIHSESESEPGLLGYGYGYSYAYERAYFTYKDLCPNQ